MKNLWFLWVWLLCVQVHAQPIVMQDFGGDPVPWTADQWQSLRVPQPLGSQPFKQVFPIRTTLLRPGLVNKRSLDTFTTLPVFVVGFDAVSLQWLRHYEARLKQLNAQGIVVNIDTEQQLKHLLKIIAPLQIHAMNGDHFHTQLGISHYPFLIANGELSQ